MSEIVCIFCNGCVCVGDATVTICHRYTPPEHLPICTKMADFVIVATGIPNLITKDMIKPGT